MTISELVRELVTAPCELAVPKRDYSPGYLRETYATVVGETDNFWLITCRHTLHDPASDDVILAAERKLGFKLPNELKQFLAVSNGAALFSVYHKVGYPSGYWTPRYVILDASELAARYRRLVEVFRAGTRRDPAYQDVTELNYLPFCDIGDGSFLGILVADAEVGHVIHVDFDYAFTYLPYDDFTRDDGYALVAPSIEGLLRQLIETRGWGTLGRRSPPL